MKRGFLVSVCVLCFSALLAAEDVYVDYVEGMVEVKDAKGWKEIAIGDALARNATIRLGATSCAELSSGTIRLSLTSAGIYDVEKLLAASKKNSTSGVGTLLAKKLEKTVVTQKSTQSAVMGVRAEKVDVGNEIEWVIETDPEELIRQGLEKLGAGDYRRAAFLFEEARNGSEGGLYRKASYYAGYAEALQGNTIPALKDLAVVNPAKTDEYYNDYIILRGKLLVETFAYQDALNFFKSFDKSAMPKDVRQTVCLFEGIAYRETGKSALAAESFRIARDLDPASDAGKIAAELMN